VISWSTPQPEHKEPERQGVINFIAVILFPGLAPEGEILTDGPCVGQPEAGR
jgi:hypothetical protein